MDFDLSDEQRQLKDSIDRLLKDAYDLNLRKGYMKEPKGYSDKLYAQYAELGLTAVPFAEDHGGLGQGLTETMIIAEASAARLRSNPICRASCSPAACHAGNASLAAEVIPALIEGKQTVALAFQERQSPL